MTIDNLNTLPEDKALSEFFRCCGCARWASRMTARRPYRSVPELLEASDSIWKNLLPADWKEAFTHHPRIGDTASLREKFRSTATLAAKEQQEMILASEEVLQKLAEGNAAYERKFGHIFIVCATGKGATEMLSLLQTRFHNDRDKELLIAAEEQRKITAIRLETLFSA